MAVYEKPKAINRVFNFDPEFHNKCEKHINTLFGVLKKSWARSLLFNSSQVVLSVRTSWMVAMDNAGGISPFFKTRLHKTRTEDT